MKKPSPWSAGVVTLANTQPYRGTTGKLRVFPSLAYRGERLQWMGPFVQVRLAEPAGWQVWAKAGIDFAAYEEGDSDVFEGLGDREDTVLAGLLVSREISKTWRLQVSGETDALQRHMGSRASFVLSRSIARPWERLSGGVDLGAVAENERWTDDRVGTMEYRPGVSLRPQLGGRLLWNVAGPWKVMANLKVEMLDGEWTDSPLVGDSITASSLVSLIYQW